MFKKEVILKHLESLRRPNGSFIAAPNQNYSAMWFRDLLYSTFCYWYLGDYEKLLQGISVGFDFLHKYKEKIILRTASTTDIPGSILHAKVNADTLEEITGDFTWGHQQLDAIGLFLYIIAHLHFNNLKVVRNERDSEMIQLLVLYLRSIEYWDYPDYGMWEECRIRHSSSIGAVLGGLYNIKRQRLALVPDSLIQEGERSLYEIFPYESRDKCARPHHSHDCDSAQLFLIWPYHVIADLDKQDLLISQIIKGHTAENGDWHCLSQDRGFNRYWGDDYYRSTDGKYRGISAMWPMFKFLVSIIYSQRHEYDKSVEWFQNGTREITEDGKIPEAYKDNQPNDNTPLAWAHSLALIAFCKLPNEFQQKVSE